MSDYNYAEYNLIINQNSNKILERDWLSAAWFEH